MKGNRVISLLFKIGIFILVLETAHAWLFWYLGTSLKALLYFIIFILGYSICQKQKRYYKSSEFYIIAVFFLFIAHVMKTGSSLLGIGEELLYILIMWLVMVQPIDQKREILDFQTKFLALLLLVSFGAWVVHFFVQLPYSEIRRPGFEHLPSAHNYYFFITTYMGLLDYRFHSIFLEPGHLGCIISFFVIANQFDFKNKYVVILSVILLFTLSLAGFVIFFIGFIFYSLNRNKNKTNLMRIVGISLVFLGIWLFGVYYNGGDNYVNERVIERLEYDEETGDIAGDNRYTEAMERTFEKTIHSGDVLFGMPIEQFRVFRETAGNGAGIKIWIIQKGIVGALMLFLGYFFVAKGSTNRRWAMFILLVYAISSYQRMYFFWAGYLIPFICGTAMPFFTRQNKS